MLTHSGIRLIVAVIMGMTLGITTQAADAVWLTSAKGIVCDEGMLRLAWGSITLLEEKFSVEIDTWQIENYNKALSFEKKQEAGVSYLSIYRKGKPCDTAFSISSRTFPVTPSAQFNLRIIARGDSAFMRPRGHGAKYAMCVQWLTVDGQSSGDLLFGLDCRKDAWQETRIAGVVPAGAVSATISIGADSPNIRPDQPLDLQSVVFVVQKPGAFETKGEAVSRPFPVKGNATLLRWQAASPSGTRVAFQISCAPDDHGEPGVWSSFIGPDGETASWFEKSGQSLPPFSAATRWLRYCVRLTSDNVTHTPILSRVLIGDVEDATWRGVDHAPPVLKNMSPNLTKDAHAPISFSVSDATGLNMASLRFWVDGKDETKRLQRENGHFIFTPDTPFAPLEKARDALDIPPNLHIARVEVKDQADNRLDTSWPLLIGTPNTGNRVTLRADGTVLLNQKPFFPVGIYSVSKKAFNSNSFDRAFAELRDNGFNVAHTYGSARNKNFREFMDAAERHDIRLFIASRKSANCMDMRVVLEDVARERSHPALLAWYLADDTSSHVTPQDLTQLSAAIRAIDPDRITVQADGVGKPPHSNYADFVDATDGFLPELYPIRGADDVPQIITDMQTLRADIQAAGNPVKTVWPIIQYFEGWGWPRFPTPDELRAMSFLALIHGANGITWYTYGGHGENHGATHTAETWRTMCEVSKEISALQAIMLSETAATPPVSVIAGPPRDSQGHPAISVLAKRYQGKLYLLCANSSKAEVQVTLPLKDARTVTDLQAPKRKLLFANGGLTDTFKPYGVRVYLAE